jgi:deoxyribonuclease-4
VAEKKPLLGAHMSVAGGLANAVTRALSINCTALQIFTKSNRQWHAAPLKEEEISSFKQAVADSGIGHNNIIVHAAYLINIASTQAETSHKSIAGLIDELTRCHQLDIPYLVLHPGSALDNDKATSLKTIAHSLDQVFEAVPGHTKILLETMAGQGSSLCDKFEQIAEVLHHTKHKNRVGVCLDTCHVFAAGYDLRTPETYHATWKKFDETIGLNRLHAIHLNDSKKELGSHVDRHEDIGKGALGIEVFRLLMNDHRLANIPKILETPETTDVMQDYAKNLETLRSLIK